MIRRLIPSGVRRWVKGRVRASLDRLLSAQSGRRVLHGPFRGMVIPQWRSRGPSVRFLVGTHESELHPVVERLVAAGFRTIINCGAGRGYYAVGFAFRCKDAHIIAYETDARTHPDIALAAEANGVGDRVAVRGACRADTLRDCLAGAQPPVLVFADIEGDELTVFDGAVVAGLSHATVLVETHDNRAPGATRQLLSRFAATHRVEAYTPGGAGRTRGDLPAAVSSGRWSVLSPVLLWIMREQRVAGQQWLLFTPQSAH